MCIFRYIAFEQVTRLFGPAIFEAEKLMDLFLGSDVNTVM